MPPLQRTWRRHSRQQTAVFCRFGHSNLVVVNKKGSYSRFLFRCCRIYLSKQAMGIGN